MSFCPCGTVLSGSHWPESKQDYPDEQRQACLLPESRYFGGDLHTVRRTNSGDEMQLSVISCEQKKPHSFCKPGPQIIGSTQAAERI